jgi:hypothetical protein
MQKNRKISFISAPSALYSLAMNPTQKQFSLTGVSLKKQFPMSSNQNNQKRPRYLITILCLLAFTACVKSDSDPIEDLNSKETFVAADKPVEYVHESITMHSPWGYKKSANAARSYPLVVSGMWGEGERYYNAVAKDYPAFVIDYQKSSPADGKALAKWIKSAINAGYRININRIYLTGFSYGGSSSYPLAKGMYAEGVYFAAMIRVAGQSQSDLGNDIAQKTAVWYHIGLKDDAVRVEVARSALTCMRNYACNKGASETKTTDSKTGYERTTVTLTRASYPMFKYSEYKDMGHTPGPCYKDGDLLPWLFSHSLK